MDKQSHIHMGTCMFAFISAAAVAALSPGPYPAWDSSEFATRLATDRQLKMPSKTGDKLNVIVLTDLTIVSLHVCQSDVEDVKKVEGRLALTDEEDFVLEGLCEAYHRGKLDGIRAVEQQ